MPSTDEYTQCEEGLVALVLEKLPQYFAETWQVSDDDTVLGKGAEYFLVYRPGSFPNDRIRMGEREFHWRITCDLFVAFKEYKTSWNRFKAVRGDLIRLVEGSPTLAGTPNVSAAHIESEGEAVYFKFMGAPTKARPNFIIQTFRVIVTQRILFENYELRR